MDCVCIRACQTRTDQGKIVHFVAHEIHPFKICPPHFVPLGGENHDLDFMEASREELMNTKWSFSDAAKSLQEHGDIELKQETGDTKKTVVDRILDIRYRSIK